MRVQAAVWEKGGPGEPQRPGNKVTRLQQGGLLAAGAACHLQASPHSAQPAQNIGWNRKAVLSCLTRHALGRLTSPETGAWCERGPPNLQRDVVSPGAAARHVGHVLPEVPCRARVAQPGPAVSVLRPQHGPYHA